MPANGGLFQCVLRVSWSLEGTEGRFRTSVSAAKNPVPGAEKVWWRELRLEAVDWMRVLRVSRSPEGHAADFGPQSLRQKIPFLAPKSCGGESFA